MPDKYRYCPVEKKKRKHKIMYFFNGGTFITGRNRLLNIRNPIERLTTVLMRTIYRHRLCDLPKYKLIKKLAKFITTVKKSVINKQRVSNIIYLSVTIIHRSLWFQRHHQSSRLSFSRFANDNPEIIKGTKDI